MLPFQQSWVYIIISWQQSPSIPAVTCHFTLMRLCELCAAAKQSGTRLLGSDTLMIRPKSLDSQVGNGFKKKIKTCGIVSKNFVSAVWQLIITAFTFETTFPHLHRFLVSQSHPPRMHEGTRRGGRKQGNMFCEKWDALFSSASHEETSISKYGSSWSQLDQLSVIFKSWRDFLWRLSANMFSSQFVGFWEFVMRPSHLIQIHKVPFCVAGWLHHVFTFQPIWPMCKGSYPTHLCVKPKV